VKVSDFLTRQVHAIWQRKGLISTLLLPLSWIVRLGIAHKQKRYRQSNQPPETIPVIVVGNLIVGGTGKTPVVIALVEALRARGWQPGVISRGYGVQLGGQARAGQGHLDPRQFGDEPALIAQATGAPLAVHPRRILALRQLRQTYPGVDVVIADDGLQHLALARDIEIVVQDARGLGNGRVLPAGPLREPAGKLASIDYLITNLTADQTAPAQLPVQAKQLVMRLSPATVTHLASGISINWVEWHARYAHAPTSAVAAIGQPERFFSMLRANGIKLAQALALPDHDPYEQPPFTAMSAELILITAKDAVKCARFNDDRLWVVNAVPQFSDGVWLDDLNQRLTDIAKKKTAEGIKLSVLTH
jgi:tetraacyldisaccharide 4'-kinase